MASLEPRLSQFGPAVGWLIARDVSAARLASLFDTTPENIRVIAFRARHRELVAIRDIAALDRKPIPELAKNIGIRPALDDAAWTPARTRKLDWLRDKIDKTVARLSAQYDFLNGARELRLILPYIGYAGDARRIALQALVHQHIAWFLVHSGRCVSAAAEAGTARDLWRVAWHESDSHDFAQGFVRAALIGSHAWLLLRRPEETLTTLDVARDAVESIRSVLGSDHYRQRGVAFLQLRQDAQAAEQFRKSAETMEKLNEATVPAQVAMTGTRHTGLLGGLNCDQGYDVLAGAQLAFGDKSLETSMALHWAAASCLSSDSAPLIRGAVEQLKNSLAPSAQFGHQLTIRGLLIMTPELGLDDRLRRVWVRRALYENAFRDS
jgi:hypothetical protein